MGHLIATFDFDSTVRGLFRKGWGLDLARRWNREVLLSAAGLAAIETEAKYDTTTGPVWIILDGTSF